jgi:hypothetical protein
MRHTCNVYRNTSYMKSLEINPQVYVSRIDTWTTVFIQWVIMNKDRYAQQYIKNLKSILRAANSRLLVAQKVL